MTLSRLQEAFAAKEQIWGGWVVGRPIIGPEEFAAAGYDYVGFDIQHGYLDDADVALLLRGLEHVPSPPRCDFPSADAAPIGRVLDAGADAVIVAMVESAEQAAAAVAATRYAPSGVRSFGPLRAEPRVRPSRARGEGECVRDDRDGTGARRARRDLRRAGTVRCLCRPCGPGDLAGASAAGSPDYAGGARRGGRAFRPQHRKPAWSPPFTPTRASPERRWPRWAFG